MNELEAKSYLTKLGGANNSDHECMRVNYREAQVTILFQL